VVDTGDDAAAPADPDREQGRTDIITEPDGMATAGEAKEPSKTPDAEEREDVGQEMVQVGRHGPAISGELQIYPDADPYCNKAPLWVRGALQSIGPLTQELSTLEHIPNCSRITELVLQLIDALAPVCLENPIREEKRGTIVNLLRYCGYKNFADQLSRRWLELDEAQAPRNGGDESTMSPGGREEEPTNEIDVVPSTDGQQARVGALEGGKAIIVSHCAVFGIKRWPVRKWKVSPPGPQAQYPVSVTVSFVEPRKRQRKCTEIYPDNRRYLIVELDDGTVLYDSRAEVPWDSKKTWPSREEWAKNTRSCAGENPNPASQRLSEYASPAEVELMVGALKQSYRDLGRRLAEAKAAAGAGCRRPSETNKEYSRRRDLMSDHERSLVGEVVEAQRQRGRITQTLKLIARDELPLIWDEGGGRVELATATARYEAASRAAEQAWRDEVAHRPIDDPAWEGELQRRARIERWNPLEVDEPCE
jgi:hypothetical protein